jgi:hypothetical protein
MNDAATSAIKRDHVREVAVRGSTATPRVDRCLLKAGATPGQIVNLAMQLEQELTGAADTIAVMTQRLLNKGAEIARMQPVFDAAMACNGTESTLSALWRVCDQADPSRVHHLKPLVYGCHCDIEAMPDGFVPDACVLDGGVLEDCTYAVKLIRKGKGKGDCEFWQPIQEHK